MEIKAKQRLIGAAVLLAILTIFVPLLFFNPHLSTSLSIRTTIPRDSEKKIVANLQLFPCTLSTTLYSSPVETPLPHTTSSTPVAWKPTSVMEMTAIHPSLPTLPMFEKQQKLKKIKKSYSLKSLSPSTTTAWIMQVASFSNYENAMRLLQQLRSNGLDAYIQQRREGEIIARVFVGPQINHDKMDKIQKKLQRQMRLNSIIRKYSPAAIPLKVKGLSYQKR